MVLNADFRPLNYYPLSVWGWQDAVKAVFLERVSVVSVYDRRINSPSFSLLLPSVVALKSYIHADRKPSFTRFNVFLRDCFRCQYCGSQDNLTFDHLIPRSKGGKTCWNNIVTACSGCNTRKGASRLEEIKMYPQREPFVPTLHDLQKNARLLPSRRLHESWHDFLYWDSELEP